MTRTFRADRRAARGHCGLAALAMHGTSLRSSEVSRMGELRRPELGLQIQAPNLGNSICNRVAGRIPTAQIRLILTYFVLG